MKRFFVSVVPLGICVWLGLEHGLWAVPPVPRSVAERSSAPTERRAKPLQAPAAAGDASPGDRRATVREPSEAGPARYIAIGGGATPVSTEVSLEQDMALARQVLPGPGVVFFAGGAEAVSVRSLHPLADPESLLARLGDLFAPRTGRHSQYRRPTLAAAPATLSNVEQAIERALGSGKDTLLVYVAAHGEQGERARDNYIDLWGGELLTVSRVADLHAAHRRPLRLLVASCYSGGFGELAFEAADAAKGVARAPRCGLFAGPWDRQTSGCDPNPDRGAQEGYSMHVLHALLGQDRNGKPLPAADIDFDHDGRIGLLEAHTRARIASQSIDLPTTTSERYLREVEHRHGPITAAGLPEDAAVVAQLGKRLGLATKARAEQQWKELSAQLDGLDERLERADAAHARAATRLSVELLGRWPVLDDPYHADFAATLQKHAKAIKVVLDASPEAQELQAASGLLEALDVQLRVLEPQEAVVMRLLRAYETLSLAAALASRGGVKYQNYRALLECERAKL